MNQRNLDLNSILRQVAKLKSLPEAELIQELERLLPVLWQIRNDPTYSGQLKQMASLSTGPNGSLEILSSVLSLLEGQFTEPPQLRREAEKLARLILESNLVVPGFSSYEALREALAKNTFSQREDTPWPTAELKEGQSTGQAQLIPALLDEHPLMPPDEVEKWSELMWKQREELSDLDADALDMLSHVWLAQAGSADDYAVGDVDEFLVMRGLKPKQGGDGRRGGFEPEQRTEMLKALSHIQNLWLNMGEVEFQEERASRRGRRKKSVRNAVQSRAFVITDRMGQIRLDGQLDVNRFMFRPGVLFSRFLYGPGRQTALLSAKAVQYDPYRQRWEKRLARYLSWQWRLRAQHGNFNRAYLVEALLEAVGETPGNYNRYPARVRERLEKALETLVEDKVIAGWEYQEWNEATADQRGWAKFWLATSVLIAPPQSIRETYHLLRQHLDNNELDLALLSGSWVWAELVKAHRKERGLSQTEAALELGVSQGYLSKLEKGQVSVSDELENRLKQWVGQSKNSLK